MLNQFEIVEFAIKGVYADIEKLEQSIKKGKQLLKEFEENGKSKTSKTPFEIHQVIQAKKAEIEELTEVESELKWKLSELQDEF